MNHNRTGKSNGFHLSSWIFSNQAVFVFSFLNPYLLSYLISGKLLIQFGGEKTRRYSKCTSLIHIQLTSSIHMLHAVIDWKKATPSLN